VWAHGGIWQGGSVAGWHEACADLARLAGCILVCVQYRLAFHQPPAGAEFPVESPLRAWLAATFRGVLAAPTDAPSGETSHTTGRTP
jgi:acetyl esterase/lipase